MSEPLTKVDSAVEGLSLSTTPPKETPKETLKEKPNRRASSMVSGVSTMKELKDARTEIKLAIETQGTGWKINTSPTSIEDKDILTKPLVLPLVKAVDIHFPHGIVIQARNRTGLTIKDALDAIYHKYKKRADDELDQPYLIGFEWKPPHVEERFRLDEWDRIYIHLDTTPGVISNPGGSKKKKKQQQKAE
ncbi:hypothetical protein F5B20DRAFT_597283 [Whalleya microplaca]|nr:hypothetical protein F5B20DRAFT_597283 [Whalleya microplaca]